MNSYCKTCCIYIKDVKNLKRHYLSNRHKKNNLLTSEELTAHHICCCGKVFTQSSNLSRHRKKCKQFLDSNISMNNANEAIVEQQKQQIQQQQGQIDTLTNQITMLLEKGIHNTTNNIETQNVNIVVNSFGNENTEYLTDKIVCRLIQTAPFTCLPEIIEKIHFDPAHPENHNVKITNKKLNYAEIIKDNQWITTNKKKVIEKMIQNGYDILEDKFNDNKGSMSEVKQERFENFQQKYSEDDKELIKNIKDEVDIILINGTNNTHNK